MNLNPMGLSAVTSTPYIQPNTANPTPNPQIGATPTGANSMGLSWPIPLYREPVSISDVPRGFVVASTGTPR